MNKLYWRIWTYLFDTPCKGFKGHRWQEAHPQEWDIVATCKNCPKETYISQMGRSL